MLLITCSLLLFIKVCASHILGCVNVCLRHTNEDKLAHNYTVIFLHHYLHFHSDACVFGRSHISHVFHQPGHFFS